MLWDKDFSIFKTYKEDNIETFRKCLEFDLS
jgi:hypothetical protein